MDILYCGDKNIERGVLISVVSLLRHAREPLSVTIMTLEATVGNRSCRPVDAAFAARLEGLVRSVDAAGSVRLVDASDLFVRNAPKANARTRFTPWCMLRLFADQVPDMPDKILYLDNDVVCRRDPSELFTFDVGGCEFAGVLDYYGSRLFKKNPPERDYVNSGVLLLNMPLVRETRLFARCRDLCASKWMLMPDQSALNRLAAAKKLLPRRFNDQRRLHDDTVLQHFTTTFRFFPVPRTVTVKPWEREKMHRILGLHEYDDLLDECAAIERSWARGGQRVAGRLADPSHPFGDAGPNGGLLAS